MRLEKLTYSFEPKTSDWDLVAGKTFERLGGSFYMETTYKKMPDGTFAGSMREYDNFYNVRLIPMQKKVELSCTQIKQSEYQRLQIKFIEKTLREIENEKLVAVT